MAHNSPLRKEKVERFNMLMEAMLVERRIWSLKFKEWLDARNDGATQEEIEQGLDEMLKDPGGSSMQDEAIQILEDLLPGMAGKIDRQHIGNMLDLYAMKEGYTWDGMAPGHGLDSHAT